MSIAIGVPSREESVPWYFFSDFCGLVRPPGAKLVLKVAQPVDIARNGIVEDALADPAVSHVFFMDVDMRFHPQALARLFRCQLPIVSGVYFSRTDTPLPHVYDFVREQDTTRFYRARGEDLARWCRAHPEQADRPNTWCFEEDDIIQCDAIGAGCLLVAREVFEKIGYPWFSSFETTGGGEDFDFCEKARAAGYDINVNLAVQCDHEARPVFLGREDYVSYWDVGTEDEQDWYAEKIFMELTPNGYRRRAVGNEVRLALKRPHPDMEPVTRRRWWQRRAS